MSKSPPLVPDQHGRTILITGANSGLGLRSAEALAAAGATVLLACRNETKAAAALEQVRKVATGEEPRVVRLDLADLDSVKACAEEVDGSVDRLDVLMNNAGVMAIPLSQTQQGFEMQFGTNHLGHFALTGRLLPTLLRAAAPRVVTESSTGHRMGKIYWDDLDGAKSYSKWRRYGQTKLANLLFTKELDRQARTHGTFLIAAAAHPGYSATNLTVAGPGQSGTKKFWTTLSRLGDSLIAQSDVAGAIPQVHAATAHDVVGNDYYGPSGLGEQRGWTTKRVKRTRAASNAADAKRLWVLSEELTGVSYPWPDATAPS
jgi:NAD(P)-dependent dehydrogenase (short-subunit alcohol dehydrogenase family)